jgi:aminomuconate-semialdehyde/2-hydroxymuconate-6-semialdehyde dehydrogenase
MTLKIYNFINGEIQNLDSSSRKFSPNYSPIDGTLHSYYPESTEVDLEYAVQSASAAQKDWADQSIQERGKILRKLSGLIQENFELFVKCENIDTGKPISLCRNLDIPRSIQNFEAFSEISSQFKGDIFVTDKSVYNYTLHQPLGVVGIISPWNLPLYLLTWKIAPALVMGNTVIAKPSELTPLTAFELSKLFNQAGLPKGVINILHGKGSQIGELMINHPKIKAISFTGGSQTGARIQEVAGLKRKKVSLELGGKNPAVIFSDCPYEETIKTVARSAFLNQGQICLCSSRILIEENIYEKFKRDLLKEIYLNFKVNNPLDPKTTFGALISSAHLKKVQSYLDLAEREGGKNLMASEFDLTKNQFPNETGYYFHPAVIEGLAPTSRVNQEEIFGPIITLTPFKNEEEALRLANDVLYGLSASLWTENFKRAHQFSSLLECGVVWVNSWMIRDLRTPLGGHKISGLGREGGEYSLHFFTQPKNICLKF